jgi:hypothetical protein
MIESYLDSEGKVVLWPARKRGKDRLEVLRYLVSKFDPEREYREPEVNEILRSWHQFDDPALLRRELFDRGFMTRNLDGTGYRRLPDTEPKDASGV